MDMVLRQMLISELISQVECKGGAVVLPMHLHVHTVEADHFREYKNQLSGFTTETLMKFATVFLLWACTRGLCPMQQRPQQAR